MLPSAASDQELRQVFTVRSCQKGCGLFHTSTALSCNSLPAGAPRCLLDRPESVLNAAAWLTCNRRRFDHLAWVLCCIGCLCNIAFNSNFACWSSRHQTISPSAPYIFLLSRRHCFISRIYVYSCIISEFR